MRKPLRQDNEYNEYVKDFYRKIESYDWVEVTDRFKGLESFFHRARERSMKKLINRYGTGDCYLDVGCGTGLILRHLPPGAMGIDLNPRHLEQAHRHCPHATVQIGDAEHIPFPDNAFTTVICTEVLEHLVHPETALAEIRRVLQPGGRLIGSTPRKAFLWRFRFLSSTHFHNEPFHNEFLRPELEALCKPFKTLMLKTGFLWSNYFFVLEHSTPMH